MERDIGMSKEIEVDGYRYLVTHPDPEVAWDIGVELVKLIGAPIAAMSQVDKGKDGKPDPESAGKAMSNAVSMLLSKLDPRASMAMAKRILRTVELQGAAGEANRKMLLDDAGIKIHFHGRVGSMMKVLTKTVEFTHSDFFSAIKDGIARMNG